MPMKQSTLNRCGECCYCRGHVMEFDGEGCSDCDRKWRGCAS